MTAAITAVIRMDTPEWLSMQSLPVSLLARLSVGPRDHLRLGASLRLFCQIIDHRGMDGHPQQNTKETGNDMKPCVSQPTCRFGEFE